MTKRSHFDRHPEPASLVPSEAGVEGCGRQAKRKGTQKKDVKYNKTNPSVLAGPWTIYRPWRNRRNAVNHGHMQRKDGFQKSRAEPFSGSAIKRHPERTRSLVLEEIEG